MANSLETPSDEAPSAMTNAMAIANRFAIAEDPAKPALASASPGQEGPSHPELLKLVLTACGDNVEDRLHHPQELKPIRILMRDGYDLQREILPIMQRVPAMSSKLRTFRAEWIRRELDAARSDAVEAGPDAAASPASDRVFVEAGTPEWTAWHTHAAATGKAAGYPTIQHKGRRGWHFPARWPPVAEPRMTGVAAE